ncbi:hypothetical protein [Glaciihabitans sp. GrIS 2.15]|uniref:hypothetical protein n=1 Tax=Glaciihabitans sp. GrIS 2.15 TaxID=3071710 RepID=UPI002DFD4B04|nr:hypothetical protein [Glaciihabitans sp. GrIS 2.15]
MGEHTIKALRGETWKAFAALCSRNNGDGSKPVAPTRLWCSTGHVDCLPENQITCFFVDRRYRGEGVTMAALDGAMFERAGFNYERPKGKNHCIIRKLIEPS